MDPIALNFVGTPVWLAPDHKRPSSHREVKLDVLCSAAKIACRTTIENAPKILLHSGTEHYRSPGIYYVGVGKLFSRCTRNRVSALRVLEMLAYAFMDYGARESVCGRGLFVGTKPPGRPSKLGRRMTAAERMRAMRASR